MRTKHHSHTPLGWRISVANASGLTSHSQLLCLYSTTDSHKQYLFDGWQGTWLQHSSAYDCFLQFSKEQKQYDA